jgi:hypothetical protein
MLHCCIGIILQDNNRRSPCGSPCRTLGYMETFQTIEKPKGNAFFIGSWLYAGKPRQKAIPSLIKFCVALPV